jgi:hypothetical protein
VKADIGVAQHGGQREILECNIELIPEIGIRIVGRQLRFEAVLLVDHRKFVIAPQQKDAFGILAFEREKEENDLNRIFPAVDVVAEEHNSLGVKGSDLEERPEEIEEIAVEIANDPGRKGKVQNRDWGLLERGGSRVNEIGDSLRREPGDGNTASNPMDFFGLETQEWRELAREGGDNGGNDHQDNI